MGTEDDIDEVVTELDEATVTDARGELVNQIGGTIKRTLVASGGEIMLAVPSLVPSSRRPQARG